MGRRAIVRCMCSHAKSRHRQQYGEPHTGKCSECGCESLRLKKCGTCGSTVPEDCAAADCPESFIALGDFCGCCGAVEVGQTRMWCSECERHLGAHGAPWDRTFYAVHGRECPVTLREMGAN